MTVYVLATSGDYTDTINGEKVTAECLELIVGFRDQQRAVGELKSAKWDVKEPEKWGVRGICVYPVEIQD